MCMLTQRSNAFLMVIRSSPGCGPKKKSRKLLDSDSEGGSDVEACGGGDGDQSEGRRTQEEGTTQNSPPEDS